MENNEIRQKMQEEEAREKTKNNRKQDKIARKIDRANRTPSRVTVTEIEGGWRLTVRPPLFRRYFRGISIQSFWTVFFGFIPVTLTATFLMAPLAERLFFPSPAGPILMAVLIGIDVPLFFFILFVKLFRTEFHLQLMDGKYAILRGKGMRFKRSGNMEETGWQIKYGNNGWARMEWRTGGTWWGFDYLNNNDIGTFRDFFMKRTN